MNKVVRVVLYVIAGFIYAGFWFHSGMAYRQSECNESYNMLQDNGVLADTYNERRLRNWDYIQTLLCDGENAGEAE